MQKMDKVDFDFIFFMHLISQLSFFWIGHSNYVLRIVKDRSQNCKITFLLHQQTLSKVQKSFKHFLIPFNTVYCLVKLIF